MFILDDETWTATKIFVTKVAVPFHFAMFPGFFQ
jgi:hypothetical protein